MPDTPTPAPALTDEQIEHCTRMYVSAACQTPDEAQHFARWYAAVIARAKREAAEEIARQVNASADALIDGNSYWCGHIDGMRIAAKIAREATNDSH